MTILASNRYVKPSGYRTITPPSAYKPFNGYLGGDKTWGPRLVTAQSLGLLFAGVPADLSVLTIEGQAFTFKWNVPSSPGVIPLVAGGGTIAQAATSALTVLGDELVGWTVTQTASDILRATKNEVGENASWLQVNTNITISNNLFVIGNVLPAKAGKCFGVLSAG